MINESLGEIDGFALRPGMSQGDSVLLLNHGRNGRAFDSSPGRYGVIAVLASADSPAAIDALQALQNSRRFVDSGKAAFFAAAPGQGVATKLASRFPSVNFLDGADEWTSAFGVGPDGRWVIAVSTTAGTNGGASILAFPCDAPPGARRTTAAASGDADARHGRPERLPRRPRRQSPPSLVRSNCAVVPRQ